MNVGAEKNKLSQGSVQHISVLSPSKQSGQSEPKTRDTGREEASEE